MDEIRRDKHKAFISEVVTIEINRADQKTAAGLRDLIKEIDPEELYLDEDSQALAERYVKQGIIPAKE